MPNFEEVKKAIEKATVKKINTNFSQEDKKILDEKLKNSSGWQYYDSHIWRKYLLEGRIYYGTEIFANQVDCWHADSEIELNNQNKIKDFWTYTKIIFKGITGVNVPTSWHQYMDDAIRAYGEFLWEQLKETDVSKRITKAKFNELKDAIKEMIARYIEHIYYTKYAPILLWYMKKKGESDPGDKFKDTRVFIGSLIYHGGYNGRTNQGSWISDIENLSTNFK